MTVTTCRCDEPDADPYECEAGDCTMRSHLLGVAGGGGQQARARQTSVTVRCPHCDWSSTWRVVDGSAQAELHGHVVRNHNGSYEKASST